MRQKALFLLFSICTFSFAEAQLNNPSTEQTLILEVEKFFDSMRIRDTVTMRQMFHPEAHMFSIYTDTMGVVQYKKGSVDAFLISVGMPGDKQFDERIYSYKINVDGVFAAVETDYAFYYGNAFLHCGINYFEFLKTEKGWQIVEITDTRHREGCQDSPKKKINALLDNWHRAAAIADAKTFFGSMTEDAVYIGTDEEERWVRDELRVWSEKYFAKSSAWDFKPTSRNVSLSSDKSTAWFDEKLDTWMGTCLGSGVLEHTPSGWKLAHYHLAFTVDNEKMDSVLKLLEGK